LSVHNLLDPPDLSDFSASPWFETGVVGLAHFTGALNQLPKTCEGLISDAVLHANAAAAAMVTGNTVIAASQAQAAIEAYDAYCKNCRTDPAWAQRCTSGVNS
jgi:hypothetical protein